MTKNFHDLRAQLADITLSILVHPDCPPVIAKQLINLTAEIGMPRDQGLAPMEDRTLDRLFDLLKQLGSTISQILRHKRCPTLVYNALANLMANIVDVYTPSQERQVEMARGTFVSCLWILTAPP